MKRKEREQQWHRKARRVSMHMVQPAPTNGANVLILQKFKVSVLLVQLQNYTVVAADQQDAAKKVAAGAGANAGAEGPVPIAWRIHPMEIVDAAPITLQSALREFVAQASGQGQPQPVRPSMIQVVPE